MSFRRSSTKTYNADSLYEYAIGSLARQMRTVAEIKRLMRMRVQKQENAEALVEQVVARLKEHRYLNDTNYATVYSAYRKENEKFGRQRVISDLKAKGVHSEVINNTIAATYDGVNEEKLAREFLARKRLKKPGDQKQAARIFRTLTRAGFGARTIVSILKKWDVDDEVLSVLESEPLPESVEES